MTTPIPQSAPQPRVLSAQEGATMFDELSRRTLGISGSEFIARVEAGEFEWDQSADIDNLMSMMPLALHVADI